VPDVLLSVLRKVTARSPHLLQGVRFEFYSRFPDGASQFSRPPGLPPGLWESREPVDYLASLRLMQEADGLLTLDAPFAPSVFLPSKLIDYVGARKPIWSISPPGAATELTRSVGGWVSDPRDPCAVESVLLEFIQTLRRQRLSRASFCDENARESYSIGNVSETLAHAIRSRLFQSPRSHRFTGDA
jgi:hypothetical protein